MISYLTLLSRRPCLISLFNQQLYHSEIILISDDMRRRVRFQDEEYDPNEAEDGTESDAREHHSDDDDDDIDDGTTKLQRKLLRLAGQVNFCKINRLLNTNDIY